MKLLPDYAKFCLVMSVLACTILVSASCAHAQSVHNIPAYVDASVVPPFAEYGTSRVVNSPLGNYRELANTRFNRSVYYFNGTEGQWVKATFSYPDDKPRIAGITYLGENPPCHGPITSGYVSGYTYNITNKLINQSFYFPITCGNRFGLIIMTEKTGSPAAISQIKIEKVNLTDITPKWPAETAKSNRRQVGSWWEDPTLSDFLSGFINQYRSEAQREQIFAQALSRHIDILNFTGLTSMNYPAVWYEGAVYNSSYENSYYLGNEYGGWRLHPANFHKTMAQEYSEAGIDFWPSIRNWRLPSLENYVRSDSFVRSSGNTQNYVNAVASDGTIRNDSSWGKPPMLNCLHPLVQQAYENLVREISDDLKDYPSFKGIAFFHAVHSGHGFGTINQSYDDYSMWLFAQENGLTLPTYTGSGRFVSWYNWLKSDTSRWNTWKQWRKAKQTQLYRKLAEIISSAKPGAKLQLMVFAPNPTADEDLGVASVADYLDGAGLDLAALSAEHNITITRFFKVNQYYRDVRSTDVNSNSMRQLLAREQLIFDSGWQSPFLQEGVRSGIVFYTYMEGKIPDSIPLLTEVAKPPNWDGWEGRSRGPAIRGAGPKAMEGIAKSITLLDPDTINLGGMYSETIGMEEYLQPFAAAFQSLPAVPFTTASNNGRVVVREAQAEGYHWIYAVNTNDSSQAVSINLQSQETLSRLGLSQEQVNAGPGAPLTITLGPFGFAAWKGAPSGPPAPQYARSFRSRLPVSIDGSPSEWSSVPGYQIPYTKYLSLTGTVPPTGNDDCSAVFKSVWDGSSLYVLVQVTDDAIVSDSAPTLYNDDSAELYLDGLNEGSSAYDANDFQLTVDTANSIAGARSNQLSFQHAAARSANSYTIEYSVPFSYLRPSPSNGSVLGFDLAVNDDDGGASRDSQLMWHGDGTGWQDPRQFGDLLLLELHRADKDFDECISQPELFSFISLWHQDSTSYPMRELIDGIGKWKAGTAC